MKEITQLVGVNEVNSVDFIKTIFHFFNERIPVAIIKDNESIKYAFSFSEIINPDVQGGWIDINHPGISDDLPAQVVFTSGTEGEPKAILLNYKTLSNTVERLNKIMAVDSTIREYVGVPVHYSFGFGRCRAVIAAGGQAYIPESGFNPVEIRRMLEADSINAISAVPTLWRLILDNVNIIGEQGKKVKWIEIGSQYMSANEKKKMMMVFPNATIVQHYGLTEASRSTFLVINDVPEQYLESVGQYNNGVEIQITDDGRIKIRGDHVADGILINETCASIVDKDNWFITNDLGYIEDGYLFYKGRSDDLINCGGIKINPDMIQNKLEQRLQISNTIAISKYQCKIRGEGFLVAVLKSNKIDEIQLIDEVSDILEQYSINAKSSIKVMHLNEFPRTQTGKIQRKKITELYRPDEFSSQPILEDKYDHVLYKEFSNVFPERAITHSSTFTSLGGDSLNYVQVSMVLEEYLGYLPHNWENSEIQNLSQVKPVKKSFFSDIESSIILRVIAILAVVLTHSGFRYAGGGTLLLFVLIGYNMGRFKHNEFVRTGSWNWFGTYAVKILVPYSMLSAIFMINESQIDLSTIFLVTNLIELSLTVAFPFWFVQVLIQSLLILSIIFSIEHVRKKLKQSPWVTALFILSILVLIRVLYPMIWDTSYLRDLVPQRYVLLIWLGYCFSFARTFNQKLLMVFIGITIGLLDRGMHFTLHWLVTGSIVLAFLPRIKVPDLSKKLINMVASSTFYIFIFNGLVLLFLSEYIGLDSRVVLTVITMLACVLIWQLSVYLDIENKIIHSVRKLFGRER